MKIKYEFADETVEIEVTDEWGSILIDLDRQDYNTEHRETRRHCSLDALNLDDALLPSDEDVLGDLVATEERERLYAAIGKLEPRQQKLIRQVYFEGRSFTSIALEEGVDRTAISKATQRAIKKLKKFLS